MRYDLILAPQAVDDLRRLRAYDRATIRNALDVHLRLAEKEEVIITRHGKPAGVLIGFKSDDDWFDYRMENDPRFLQRVAAARRSLEGGRGVRLEDLED